MEQGGYFLILMGLDTDGKDPAESQEGIIDTSKVSGKVVEYWMKSTCHVVTLKRLKRRYN